MPIGLEPEPDLPPGALPRPRGPSWENYFHDALLAPLESRLSGVSRLFLVVEGTLSALPIEFMGRGSRLSGKMTVVHLSSVAWLGPLRDERRADPETAARILVLSGTSGSKEPEWAKQLRGLAAVETTPGGEASFARWLGGPTDGFGAVHWIAPADLIAGRSPTGEVGLSFGEDRRLSSAGLASVPLKCRVLILDVADPHATRGEGLRELARGGLASGAGSVLISRWTAPSASSERFFVEFHKALASGMSPAPALDAARAAVAQDPAFRDPVHWAGYALYGLP